MKKFNSVVVSLLAIPILLHSSVLVKAADITERTWHHQLDSGDEVTKYLASDHGMAREIVSMNKAPTMGRVGGKYTVQSCLNDLERIARTEKGVLFEFTDKTTLARAVPEINKAAHSWLWVQAPVAAGPGANRTGVPKTDFRDVAKSLDQSVNMVLAWSNAGALQTETPYTEKEIKSMTDILNDANVKNHKRAVEVDAVHGSHTKDLANLLRDADYLIIRTVDDSASTADKVDVPNLRKMAVEFGHQRVFLDVSHKLRDKLTITFYQGGAVEGKRRELRQDSVETETTEEVTVAATMAPVATTKKKAKPTPAPAAAGNNQATAVVTLISATVALISGTAEFLSLFSS